MTAWQVQAEATSLAWDSGRVESDQPWGVAWAGHELEDDTQYRWRVRLWGSAAEPGPWSEWEPFSTGVSEWSATWVGMPSRAQGPLYFRGTAGLDREVKRATAYVSALGWYRLLVNGHDQTGPALVPRWTPFDHEVEYQAYDVTEILVAGENELMVVVADGRFRGTNGFSNTRSIYGDQLATIVELRVEFVDGESATFVSDTSWTGGHGPITSSDPKLGERVDLRLPITCTHSVVPLCHPRKLVAEQVARVGEHQLLSAVSITQTSTGTHIVDFGQNVAGVVRLRLRGPAGALVRLTHSEICREDGSLDVDYIHELPGSRWHQRDEVVVDGTEHWWQPWFTIHGFRYVEVAGLPELALDDVACVVLTTQLPEVGSFSCSDPGLEQVHRNTAWSLRSNFTDTATDCPTRERSGWTGDIQVFAPTATTFVDVHAFIRRYLRSLALEQNPNGSIPNVIPAERSAFSAREGFLASLPLRMASSVGWGDAVVLLPLTLRTYYGDETTLAELYPAMVRWVRHLESRTRRQRGRDALVARMRGRGRSLPDGVVTRGYDWGEWLRPGERPIVSILGNLTLGHPEVATAYLARSAALLSGIAAHLGHGEDAESFGALGRRTRDAYRRAFVGADGRIGADMQDDYVRALAFDLLEPDEVSEAVRRLVAKIERAGDHLGTGFLSTPLLLPVLLEHGREDIVWRLLLQRTAPSWLAPLERGATTIWESWEGYDSKGQAKHSHNHYALGSVCQFLVERVAGLAPAAPGYKVIDVRPMLKGPLTHAGASVLTPFGQASVAWHVRDRQLELVVEVPPGATARVHLDDMQLLEAGRHVLGCSLS